MGALHAKVTIWPRENPQEPIVVGEEYEVDYISLINEETYGLPPLLTAKDGLPTVAQPGDGVLYINPDAITAVYTEREEEY
jgi:hypothetical protein